MAIYRFLQNAAFAPEDIAPLVAAYEDCLRTLKLSDRSQRRSLRSRRPEYGIRPGWASWRLRNSEFPALGECRPAIRPCIAGAAVRFDAYRAAAFVRLSAPDACVTIISVSFGGWPCISPIKVSSSSWSSALSRDGSRAE